MTICFRRCKRLKLKTFCYSIALLSGLRRNRVYDAQTAHKLVWTSLKSRQQALRTYCPNIYITGCAGGRGQLYTKKLLLCMLGPLSSNVVKAIHKRAKTFMKSPKYLYLLNFTRFMYSILSKKFIRVFIINLKYGMCSQKEFEPIVTFEQHFKNSV